MKNIDFSEMEKIWEGRRHEITRTGYRQRVPSHVRTAVYFRDHGCCEICRDKIHGEWELDHVIPWSAGGSDDSTNLRVLCKQHNQNAEINGISTSSESTFQLLGGAGIATELRILIEKLMTLKNKSQWQYLI